MAEEKRGLGVMVEARLGTSEPGEVFLSHVSASAIEAVCLLIVDSLELEMPMQLIPCCRFTGRAEPFPSRREARMMKQLSFPNRRLTDGIASTIPDYHDNLALAILFPAKPAITVMCFDISGLHAAAIDLSPLYFPCL